MRLVEGAPGAHSVRLPPRGRRPPLGRPGGRPVCGERREMGNARNRRARVRRRVIAASYIAVGRFGASRRIGFPLAASGTAPIVLLDAKSALLASVHAEALDVLADEPLHELQVVAAIG